jgi:HSP20 family protein
MVRGQFFNPFWSELQALQNGPMWRPLQNLQHEVNRIFERWNAPNGRGYAGGYPTINMWEDGDNLLVEAELPGITHDTLEVFVTGDNELTIKGERKPSTPETGVWHRQERVVGTFSRVVTLPYEVDRDKVEARLENGVLVLKLAKHVTAKPRKINVKAE